MIDYCQKNKSGCIVARQILSSLNINDGFVPLEKPFKLQVCFAFKKNNSKTEPCIPSWIMYKANHHHVYKK